MAEHVDNSFIREVEEELRQEQAQKLWKKYGTALVVVAGVFVAGVAGYEFWRDQNAEAQLVLSERFAQAQIANASGNAEDALGKFKELSAESGGYGLLARLQEAALLAKQGDGAAAIALYEAIEQDTATPTVYRGLVTILGATLAVNQSSADLQALKTKLAPLMAEGGTWRFSAQELTAVITLKEGKPDDALKLFETLAADPDAPARMRDRAGEIIGVLQ